MEPVRKKIVTQEIKYWRDSNLLPAHYCDFLLNLYTEGETTRKRMLFHWQDGLKPVLLLAAVLICLLFTVIVIYFTDFSIGMQTVLVTIFTIAVCSFIKPMWQSSVLMAQLFFVNCDFYAIIGMHQSRFVFIRASKKSISFSNAARCFRLPRDRNQVENEAVSLGGNRRICCHRLFFGYIK